MVTCFTCHNRTPHPKFAPPLPQALPPDLPANPPVAEAKMSGVMDDWRALRYTMNVTSSVDLTQLSDTLQT